MYVKGHEGIFKLSYINRLSSQFIVVDDTGKGMLVLNEADLTKVSAEPLIKVTDQGLILNEDDIEKKIDVIPDNINSNINGMFIPQKITDISSESSTYKERTLAHKLKNYINFQFYCEGIGIVTLVDVFMSWTRPIKLKIENDGYEFQLYENGEMVKDKECVLRPLSGTWDDYFNVPKTIKNMRDMKLFTKMDVHICNAEGAVRIYGKTDNESKTLAFMQLQQLINAGYGGVVSYEEYQKILDSYLIDDYTLYCICVNRKNHFYVASVNTDNFSSYNHLIFRSYKLAEEFLSYDDNKNLLKEYFGIK